MLAQHTDTKLRFDQQVINSREYVIPFIEQSMKVDSNIRVMDVGCGEGGVMQPFLELGCQCLGVDLVQMRLDLANEYLAEYVEKGQVQFINQDVYEEDFVEKHQGTFDLIVLKDVIEHVPNQEKFIPHLKKFLKPNGQIYFGFPPWYMPFGGHQQLLHGKLASKLPYYHILPTPIYKGIMKLFGEEKGMIDFMIETKETGISIERFERIVLKNDFAIVSKQWFLINPIYKFKFGLKPSNQNWLFGAVPFVRNFLTTCAYYTIQAQD